MGESVAEATLTSWLKDVGDSIEMDEAVVEIATDKVDSEVPSEHKGILIEYCHKKFNKPPIFNITSSKGPDHNKSFKVKI